MVGSVYRPGDRVPASGIYRINHHKHRLMHEATLTKGIQFPQCRRCKNRVEFSLVRLLTGAPLPFRPTDILEDYAESTSKHA